MVIESPVKIMVIDAFLFFETGRRAHTRWTSEQVRGPAGMGDCTHKGRSGILVAGGGRYRYGKEKSLVEPCGVGSFD